MPRYTIAETTLDRALIVADDGSYRAWHIATPAEAAAIALNLNRPSLLADLTAWRYERETAGITLAGVAIGTGRDDQAMLTGAIALASLDPARAIDWKAASGWVQIDVPSLQAIGRAVGDHVQACFSTESRVAARLAALDNLADCLAFDLAAAWAEEGGP